MKKITLLFFVMTFSVIQMNAQFTEGFDTEIPSSWTVINEDGGAYTWTFETQYPQAGAGHARIHWETAAHEDYLITPQFTVTAGVSDRISFYAGIDGTFWTETFEVRISTTGATASDFTTTLASETATTDADGNYTQYSYNLGDYDGQSIYVAIVATDTDRFYLYIDEFVNDASPTATLDYYNLQWPPNGTITAGEAFDVYAQAYEAGLTDVTAGQAPGIESWIGYSSTDSDPSGAGWTWTVASFNVEVNNNDEYTLDLGSVVPNPGTFYYASRWRLDGGPFTYGGILADGSNGGAWGENNNISGVLTVNPIANDDCSGAVSLTPGLIYAENPIDGTVVGASLNGETAGCGLEGPGVWYSVVVPADGNITIETGPDAATNTTTFDSVIEAFSGTCGALTSIECDDDSALTGNFSLLELSGLTPGSTIFIRVWEYNGDESEPFSISAHSATLSVVNLEQNEFTYFPNPVKNTLNLKAQSAIQDVSVYNMLGQEVLRTSPNTLNSEVDMATLQTGAYFVKVTINDSTETIRVIKQ